MTHCGLNIARPAAAQPSSAIAQSLTGVGRDAEFCRTGPVPVELTIGDDTGAMSISTED